MKTVEMHKALHEIKTELVKLIDQHLADIRNAHEVAGQFADGPFAFSISLKASIKEVGNNAEIGCEIVYAVREKYTSGSIINLRKEEDLVDEMLKKSVAKLQKSADNSGITTTIESDDNSVTISPNPSKSTISVVSLNEDEPQSPPPSTPPTS